MIQLNFNSAAAALEPDTVSYLNSVQTLIDSEPTFETKVKKAGSKWDNKTSGTPAKSAFGDVKTKLKALCCGTQICVYCEHNEATDIEHIFPKRLYPDKSFTWENYLFACSNCNSNYKHDKFKMFSANQSVTLEDITPQKKVYTQPPNDDALFINQRNEDPMLFLKLDFLNRTYYFTETSVSGTRNFEKAKFTKDVLGLNARADLVKHRQAAHEWYLSKLKKYVSVKNSVNFDELCSVVEDEIHIELSNSLEFEKNRILEILKRRILTHSHQTVWKELIKQRADLPKTNALLLQAQEILSW